MTGKYRGAVGGGRHEVQLEGNFWPSVRNGTNWYDCLFSVSVLVKRGGANRSLVPVALSASAVAYSSTRIENMFMSVGTAAGVAAKQLVDGDVAAVQDVDVSKVQRILTATFGQRVRAAEECAVGRIARSISSHQQPNRGGRARKPATRATAWPGPCALCP